jgi:hypothetical protein
MDFFINIPNDTLEFGLIPKYTYLTVYTRVINALFQKYTYDKLELNELFQKYIYLTLE